MSWQAYQLVYEAKAPVHIGWNTLGYVNRTRYYIPGKNIWAAFTACLTRAIGDKGIAGYEKIGKELTEQCISSYFYPALKKDSGYYSLLPEYRDAGIQRDAGLQYRVCPPIQTKDGVTKYWSAENFEHIFISSFAQTAVLPESETAHDGSLHESEFITPKVLIDGEPQPVYFTGYIFLKEALTLTCKSAGWDSGEVCIKDYVSEIFAGGDRKYGWGRLVLADDQAGPNDFFGFAMDTSADSPVIKLNDSNPIPAHLPVQSRLGCKGDIEPLVGRDWANNRCKKFGAGQHLSGSKICWAPGSILVRNLEDKPKTFFIKEHGLLDF